MKSSQECMNLEATYGAKNYKPIPVVINKAKAEWVWDPEGKKYLDCLSAYSAVNHGHLHPRIIKAVEDQLNTLTLTSRAFYNDRLGQFLKRLCEVSGFDMALPMNTGAEAVETGIKIARRYSYAKKNIEENKAEIITAHQNFHGRTTTIVSFSNDGNATKGYGPYTPGFKNIPFNDAEALEAAITKNTIGFLVEPIQGEAGVIIPDEGYLKKVREICDKHDILMILDEIQTGFGRTGKLFAFEHENIKPDLLLVGKALSGGVIPVSGVLTHKHIMEVITPGSHGSTFGGNPLACAAGEEALNVLLDEKLPERSKELGDYFLNGIKQIDTDLFKEVRGKGLFIAIELKEEAGGARQYTEALMNKGLLAKETHVHTIRLAPPLVVEKASLDWAVTLLNEVFTQ